MNETDTIQLPLYACFTELMRLETGQANKGVDPSSYLLLLDTLQKGYMIGSRESLLFLCKKIWLKPFHNKNHPVNEQVLNECFERNMAVYSVMENETNIPISTGQPMANNAALNENEQPAATDTDPAEDLSTKKKGNNTNTARKGELYLTIKDLDINDAFVQPDISTKLKQDNFFFNYHSLPVSRRFIEQTIRSLRYRVQGAGSRQIDLPGTVNDIARKGFFEDWQYTEQDGFNTRWTLFIDHEGSMIAFEDLLQALITAASSGSIKNDGDVFYFKNYTTDHLFTNADHTRSRSFKEIANGPRRNILVVSDAGAARGMYNGERVQKTYAMLYHLRKHRIAWLNPMPKERWNKTSAQEIKDFVQMFEPGNDNSDDLGNIVRSFKMKIQP